MQEPSWKGRRNGNKKRRLQNGHSVSGVVNQYTLILGPEKGNVNMLKLNMRLKNETKTCFRFERRDDAGNLITL